MFNWAASDGMNVSTKYQLEADDQTKGPSNALRIATYSRTVGNQNAMINYYSTEEFQKIGRVARRFS